MLLHHISIYKFKKVTRWYGVRVFGCLFGCLLPSLHSVIFGQLLRCVHKRIVNIMKLYIEMKNMPVQLIPFHKNVDFIDFGNLEVGNLRVFESGLIVIRDVSPPFSAPMK